MTNPAIPTKTRNETKAEKTANKSTPKSDPTYGGMVRDTSAFGRHLATLRFRKR